MPSGRPRFRSLLTNGALVLVSLIVALLLAEGVVRMAAPQNLGGTQLVQTEHGLWANRPSDAIPFAHDERHNTYRITPLNERAPVVQGERDLLLLGDSFAFGWLLADDDAPHTLIQRGIDEAVGRSAWSVRNVATPGWGTGDYVAFLEDEHARYAPDAVLVLLNVDDVARAGRSPHWQLSADTLTRIGVRRNAWKYRLNTSPTYQAALMHSHLLHLTRSALRNVVTPNDAVSEPPEERERHTRHAVRTTEALFKRLAAWSRTHGVPVLVLTTGWHQPPYNATDDEPTRRFIAQAPAVFQSVGLPFYDPSPDVWQQRKDHIEAFVIAGDGHPNEAGARLIAEGVLPMLIPFLEGAALSDSALVRQASDQANGEEAQQRDARQQRTPQQQPMPVRSIIDM